MRRPSLFLTIYIVVGILVAAGVIGSEGNYFNAIGSVSDVVELILVVVLWPLVLLGVNIDIGGGPRGR